MWVSINEQKKCVKREIGMRLKSYPRRVERKTMNQRFAEREVTRMRAVLETLSLTRVKGIDIKEKPFP